MKRSDMLALAAAALMSCEGAMFANGPVFRELYLPQITAWELPVAIMGWVLASYGPILIAALFWRWADRFSAGWLLHILLVPCLYALLLAGSRLMLSTVNDLDFDNTLGAPIMPGMLCDVAVMAVYFPALAVKQLSNWRARMKGR